jgi:hypothetical protein
MISLPTGRPVASADVLSPVSSQISRQEAPDARSLAILAASTTLRAGQAFSPSLWRSGVRLSPAPQFLGPLKLGHGVQDRENHLPCRRRGVHAFRETDKLDAERLERLQGPLVDATLIARSGRTSRPPRLLRARDADCPRTCQPRSTRGAGNIPEVRESAQGSWTLFAVLTLE